MTDGPGPIPEPWAYGPGLSLVYNNGGITLGNPTGGAQGIGTINVSSGLYVNGTPLTTIGPQSANLFYSSPNGMSGTPVFRSILNGDLPTNIAIGGTLVVAGTASLSSLSVSGGVSGAGVTSLFASPPQIGSLNPGTVAATLLSASGSLTVVGATNLTSLRTTGVSTLGATGWLEPIVPNTESLATTRTLSTNGFIGLVGATRSSDNSGPGGAQGSIGITGISLNNNTAFVQSGFAGYFEARRSASAGGVEGLESTVLNFGSNVSINPYAMIATGQTMALWLAAGRPDVPSATGNISTAIGVLTNGGYSSFDKGILFGNGSVVGGKAIELPAGYLMSWRESTTATITSYIQGAGTTAGVGQRLIFTDTGLFVQDISAANIVQFSLSSITALTLITARASAAGGASINIPQGVAPTTPNNGDLWMTSAGLFYRFNGTTHGPL